MAKSDFWESLNFGERGEEMVAYLLKSKYKIYTKKHDLAYFRELGVDYEYDFSITSGPNKKIKSLEVKTQSGKRSNGSYCNTFLIERFKNNKGDAPGWWRSVDAGALDYIIFVCLYESENIAGPRFFLFDPRILQKYIIDGLANKTLSLQEAYDGNKADCRGSGPLVRWDCKEAGFIAQL